MFTADQSDGNTFLREPYSIDYASISSYSSLLDPSSCECNGVVRMDYPFGYKKDNNIDILGSCNGLICMGISRDRDSATKLYKDNSICIWNPSTREYKKILIPRHDTGYYSANPCRVRYGFGYDGTIDDYKLVRILGSSTWSCAQKIPYKFPHARRCRGLLFNGTLHWLGFTITQENSPEVIVSYDISNEKALELPLPEETMLQLGNQNAHKNIGMLSDCLCLVLNFPPVHRYIWVMQEYGADASWTKQYTFIHQMISNFVYSKPIWSLRNGEILIDVDYGFLLFDPSNGSQRMLEVQEFHDTYFLGQPVIYMESLVSLNTGTYV
ncbi:F-box/kelch-repeat protein At3g06240-like [Papaver somniferum]|uniref:F-box/kelch-repeat protein At3g06240-like n=1 Tax=Papaver somniferum TaxID=3469 RepID=UPI000E70498F|nr:F-box/kelch-repeat protein At3g06240-like [Papaver somniferum]